LGNNRALTYECGKNVFGNVGKNYIDSSLPAGTKNTQVLTLAQVVRVTLCWTWAFLFGVTNAQYQRM